VKKKQHGSWQSSSFYPQPKTATTQRTTNKQTTRAQRPVSKRGITEHSVGASQPIKTY